MNIEVLRPSSLTPEQWELWSEIQAAEPALDSPYFRPEFTYAVSQVRPDVEIAVLTQEGQTVGFFPFQRGPLNIGKPVAGKLSDYHGVVARTGTVVEVVQLLQSCRLAGWDFEHLITTQPGFEPFVTTCGKSPYLDLSQGFDAYAQQRQAAGSQELRQINRKLRKCEREQGPVSFELDCRDAPVLDLLMRWKSAQFRQNGLADIFAFPWTGELLKSILGSPGDHFSALLSVVKIGERPISILYSLRAAGVAHAWIFAYDRELGQYSPGSILLLKMAENAQQNGIAKIDLGKGAERYKLSLASAATPLWEGTAGTSSPALWLRGGWRAARDLVERSPLGEFSKIPGQAIKPLREWFAFR